MAESEIINLAASIPVNRGAQMVVFQLGSQSFAVDVFQVRHIERIEHGVTRVPKAPFFVEGVFNLRGEIVPLVDLRKRFGIPSGPISEETRVVIVELEGSLIGLLVDNVPQVVRIPETEIEPAPRFVRGVEVPFLSGLARLEEQPVLILQLEAALSPENQQQIRDEVG